MYHKAGGQWLVMSKRIIKAKDIAEDIRSGKIYIQLLDKYHITPVEFRAIFKQLLSAQIVEPYQLLGAVPALGDKDASGESLFDWTNRRFDRKEIDFGMLVVDSERPHVEGLVQNISKLGIGLKGIKAARGELMSLTIPANDFFEYDTVEMEGICRWTRKLYDDDCYVTGFEALLFYQGNLEDLVNQVDRLNRGRRTFYS
jgi:hypothetical protein